MSRNEEVLSRWIMLKSRGITVETLLINRGYRKIFIYGFGKIGECLFYELEGSDVNIEGIVDKKGDKLMTNYSCSTIETMPNVDVDAVVVTVLTDYDIIKNEIQKRLLVDVISIEEVIYEL